MPCSMYKGGREREVYVCLDCRLCFETKYCGSSCTKRNRESEKAYIGRAVIDLLVFSCRGKMVDVYSASVCDGLTCADVAGVESLFEICFYNYCT